MKKITSILLTSLCLLAFGLSPAHAKAKACKGLSQTACATNDDCSWVKGYKRKDGVKVSSFCRTKAKGAKTKVKETSSKQKATTKSKKDKAKTSEKKQKKATKAKTKEELKKLKTEDN